MAAQRRTVRRRLLEAFPEGASLLELGGGTGEDALFLAERGRRILLTDGSPAMVARAREKAAAAGLAGRIKAEVLAIEELSAFAGRRSASGRPVFAGVYSNFAALNCVADLRSVAGPLARLLPPGGRALLVVFGPLPPGEVLTLLLKGRLRAAFRRLSRQPVPARVGGGTFTVTYPRPADVARAFAPWFRLRRRAGIGIFVPPSSAEPAISRWPRLLAALEAMDRVVERPLALLGDHILLDFQKVAESP